MADKNKDLDEKKVGMAGEDEDEDDEKDDEDGNQNDTDSEDDEDDGDKDNGEDDDDMTKGINDDKIAVIESDVLVDAIRDIIKAVIDEQFESHNFEVADLHDQIEALQKSIDDRNEQVDFIVKAITDGDIVVKSVEDENEIQKAAEAAELEAKTTPAEKTIIITDKEDTLSKSIGDTAAAKPVNSMALLNEAIALQSKHNVVVKGLSEFSLTKSPENFKKLQDGVKEVKATLSE